MASMRRAGISTHSAARQMWFVSGLGSDGYIYCSLSPESNISRLHYSSSGCFQSQKKSHLCAGEFQSTKHFRNDARLGGSAK